MSSPAPSEVNSTAALIHRGTLANGGTPEGSAPSVQGSVGASKAALRRARVLMFGPDLQVRGGVSAVEQLLLKGISSDADVCHIATMSEGSGWHKAIVFAGAFMRAFFELRRSRYDLVHIHFSSGASSLRKMMIAALAQSRDVRVVLHAHGGGYPSYWDKAPPLVRRFSGRVLRSADCLIVLGEAWRGFYSSLGVQTSKIVVLPNPVEWPASLPARVSRETVMFVYFGLISHTKGAFDIIGALAKIPAPVRARVRVIMAGNGALSELRELVRREQLEANVEIRDWIDTTERDALFATADALLLPSYAEGLPMSLLEAMANGVMPICTPVGSIPEYLRDGVNGLLIPPGDTTKLAGAMARVVQDPDARSRMGRIARATVEPLSLTRYVQRLGAIYRTLLGRSIDRPT